MDAQRKGWKDKITEIGISERVASEAVKNAKSFEEALEFALNKASQPAGSVTPAAGQSDTAPALSTEYLTRVLSTLQQTQNTPPVSSGPSSGPANSPAVEDEEFNRVLEMSKTDAQGPASAGTASGLSKEDEEMNRAVYLSYQTAKGSDASVSAYSDNPHYRKRDQNTAVGLKNIGQTCYVNSLLQTYFAIPELRRAVLTYPVIDNILQNDPNKDTLQFISEVQKLFVAMIYSKQKYADPSSLLKKLLGDGEEMKIGDQQDVGHFNNIFVKYLSKAFDLISAYNGSNAGSNSNAASATDTNNSNNVQTDAMIVDNNRQTGGIIKRLFVGNGEQYLVSQTEDGSKNESHTDVEFSTLILPISDQPSDLFDRIDSCVSDDNVEGYKSDKGLQTKAQQSLWFKGLPSVLMFQESRVQFLFGQSAEAVKLETPVTFAKEIFIDRYLLENREETSKRRKVVRGWKDELAKLEAELKSFTHYKGRNHGLDEALTSTLDYLNAKQENDKEDLSSMIDRLRTFLAKETNTMNDLQGKVVQFRTKINEAYSDMKKIPYTLFGVWIHQGSAGSGHYWAYIRNPVTDKWTKFNDIRVNEAEESTVMKEAVGGYASTSAYFLIYIDKNLVNDTDPNEFLLKANYPIDEKLKKAQDEQNEKFTQELEEWDKRGHGDKLERFLNKYQSEHTQIAERTKTNHIYEQDYRLRSYYAFIESLGMTDVMIAELTKDLYKQIYERGIVQDVDCDSVRQLKDKLSPELVAHATQLSLDDSETKLFRQQHQLYQDIFKLYITGLELLLQNKTVEAIKLLFSALYKQKDLNQIFHRTSEITEAICVCILAMLDQSVTFLSSPDLVNDVDPLLRSAVTVALNLFPSKSEPFMHLVRERLFALETSMGNFVPMKTRSTLCEMSGCLKGTLAPPPVPFNPIEPKKMNETELETLFKKFETTILSYKSEFHVSYISLPEIEKLHITPSDQKT